MCSCLGNVFEFVMFDMYFEVVMIKNQMKCFGVDVVLMSGSGLIVFGLVQYELKVQRIYNGLRGFCDQVYVVRMIGEQNVFD